MDVVIPPGPGSIGVRQVDFILPPVPVAEKPNGLRTMDIVGPRDKGHIDLILM